MGKSPLMPPGKALSDEDIAGLIQYIRSLAERNSNTPSLDQTSLEPAAKAARERAER